MLMKARREDLGWSQEELSRRVTEYCGIVIHATAITRIEGGTRNLRLNEVAMLAQVLGIDMGYFGGPAGDAERLERNIRNELDLAQQLFHEKDNAVFRTQEEMASLTSRYARLMNERDRAADQVKQLEQLLAQARETVAQKVRARNGEPEMPRIPAPKSKPIAMRVRRDG